MVPSSRPTDPDGWQEATAATAWPHVGRSLASCRTAAASCSGHAPCFLSRLQHTTGYRIFWSHRPPPLSSEAFFAFSFKVFHFHFALLRWRLSEVPPHQSSGLCDGKLDGESSSNTFPLFTTFGQKGIFLQVVLFHGIRKLIKAIRFTLLCEGRRRSGARSSDSHCCLPTIPAGRRN